MSVARFRLFAFGLAALPLAACTVGPDFVAPQPEAPSDWSSWRSGDPALAGETGSTATMPAEWWTLFGDPVLDRLVTRALAASPDIETAALHYAQARVQLQGAGSAALPQVNGDAAISRNRVSEYGTSTRLFDAIGSNRDALAKFLAEPFTLYRGGFDASWEVDLWGKVRRSIEQSRARASQQEALLDLTRLTIVSEVAQAYFDLRATQRQAGLVRAEIGLAQERMDIVRARVNGGLESHVDDERESASLNAMRSALPALQAREAMQGNGIAMLLGVHPGALNDELRFSGKPDRGTLPELALGLPSQVALNRPDVRAAVAHLHAATAGIGVATAELYPSIRLGGGFNLESYRSQNLFDWASRSWSIGPSLSLPIFDGGRRRSVVQLRKLEAREAAVGFQRTVLKAWQEIDDALSGYTAERQQQASLSARAANAANAAQLLETRYKAGASNYLPVLEARRAHVQALRDLADSEQRLRVRFVAINKAIGNAPRGEAVASDQVALPKRP